MTIDHVIRQTERQTDGSYFILKQFTQRLNQRHFHIVRQATHIVVRLDHMRLACFGTGRLNHIGVNGALGQKGNIVQGTGVLIKHLDKGVTNNFPLLFRVLNPFQSIQEQVFGLSTNHPNTHILGKHRHHLVAFVQTQQTVIDKHANQLIADGLMQQSRYHTGVYPTRKPQQYLLVTDLGTDTGNSIVDDLTRRPQLLTVGNIHDKALQDS